jgi:hypothetical protein
MVTFEEIEKKILYHVNDIEKTLNKNIDKSSILESVENVKNTYGKILPSNYLSLQLKYGKLLLSETVSKYLDTREIDYLGEYISVFRIHTLENKGESVLHNLNRYLEDLPSGVIPIGDDEFGNLVCLDLTDENYGKIYYWQHDADEDEPLLLVANSFDDFIMGLEKYEDDTL